MANKATYHPDFREFAILGDAILTLIILQLYKEKKVHYSVKLLSNKYLENFKRPFKFKAKRNSYKKIADEVEAYIYFLDLNYGRKASTRYVLDNIKRLNS